MNRHKREKVKRLKRLSIKLVLLIAISFTIYALVDAILIRQSSSIIVWNFECEQKLCLVRGSLKNESNSILTVILRATAIEEKWIGDARVFKQLNSVTWEHTIPENSDTNFNHKFEVFKKPDRILLKVSDKNSELKGSEPD